MKALLADPGFLAPSGTIGADISYLLAVVFTVLFLIAWGMAKKSQGTRHHKLILISMVSMMVSMMVSIIMIDTICHHHWHHDYCSRAE